MAEMRPVGHNSGDMRHMRQAEHSNGDMLDLSFVTDWSDDEGIGSDVSLENSDQSSSSGTLNTNSDTLNRNSDTLNSNSDTLNSNSDTLQRQAANLVKSPKRNISVKKFVRILRRSVGTHDTDTGELGPVSTVNSPVAECQFQSQKVFGVDLTEHLEQTSCLVPRVVEFCCDFIQVDISCEAYRAYPKYKFQSRN